MQQNRYFYLLFLLVPLLITGCISDPTLNWMTSSEAPDNLRDNEIFSHALDLEQSGQYAEAARLLERTAANTQPPLRQEAMLRAVENYLKANDTDSAFLLLQQISADEMPRLDLKRRILLSEVAIKGQRPDEALQLLEAPPERGIPQQLRRRYHYDRAEAFRLTGNMFESARQLAELDQLIQDQTERRENQTKIISALNTYTDSALDLLMPDPPGVFGGWIELARALRTNTNDPTQGAALMQRWRERFPGHPAMPQVQQLQIPQNQARQPRILQDQTPQHQARQITADYSRIRQVALLLPKNGPYAKAARALYDGIMAAYNSIPEQQRPIIKVYDNTNSSGTSMLYRRAVADGADKVIGPLVKESVAKLATAGNLEVPVLALNRVQTRSAPPENLYQFGLSPEDEAMQVAEKAWSDGYTRAIAFTPQGEWGERVFQSFQDRWIGLGGKLAERQVYNTNNNDFSVPIKALLNIDESYERRNSMRNALGRRIGFEPYRRQDADFIFLLAKSQMARQIRPQLQFYHASGLPVYTTSHSYSGIPDPKHDQDLAGVLFPDIPWLILNEGNQPLSRQLIQDDLAKKAPYYGRLYAMGIDSFWLLPHLSRLKSSSRETLDGKTGILSIEGDNQIDRQLVWAEMKNGIPEAIGYAPKLERPKKHTTPSPTRPGSSGGISDFFSW